MQLVIPFADEHVNGYLGRLCTINFHTSTNQTMKFLATHFSSELSEKDSESVVILAALAAKQSMKEFLQNHTLVPFRQISFFGAKSKDSDNAPDMISKRNSLRKLRPSAYLCLNCIEEDLAKWGISYWRRIHQLPGIDWCPDHRAPLHSICSVSAFSKLPHHLIELSKPAVCKNELIPGNDSPVWRYASIARTLLSSIEHTSSRMASAKLLNRAKILEIRLSVRGRRPTLSDHSVMSCPSKWLERLFPRVLQKEIGKSFFSIDSALRRKGTPSACTLALSVMFDCADQAIAYWMNSDIKIIDVTKHKNRGFDFWHSKEIFKKYISTKGNHHAVADFFGVNRLNANLNLRRAGLPALGNLTQAQSLALLDFFEGVSLVEACEKFNAEINVVEEFLRISSVRLRAAIKFIGDKPFQVSYKRKL